MSSFIDETKNVLLPGFDCNRISSSNFKCIKSDTPQKCILVLGMNPAGNAKVAKEDEKALYLYYLPEYNIDGRTYSKYYKPIFEVFDRATNNNAKWGWCSYPRDRFEELIEDDNKLKPHKQALMKQHGNLKDKEYSIYIGELFYYHMTSQTEFLKMIDSSKRTDHVLKMLRLHIDAINGTNNTVSLVYINNTAASRMICDALKIEGYPTFYDYKYNGKIYRILFGSMLSGQRAMDVFSRGRLITEIQQYFQIG